MKKSIPYIIIAGISLLMLIFPETSIASAKSALELCRDVIVPSLFPFFVCSGILIHSGVCRSLSRLLGPVMKPLFNVNGCGAAALVLGTISGYPQGAITACNLYEAGYLSKSEAERLLAFCNNSGPLFVLGAVGVATYASRRVGIVLYISHLIASLLVGIIFRFYKRNTHTAPDYAINQPDLCFTEVFAQVLRESVSSILTVCGAIIFFGVFSGLLIGFLPSNDVIKALVMGIFELSGGNHAIHDADISMTSKLVMSAFTVGFAGFCVHLQVAAITARHHLSLVPYIFGKFLHGSLAAILSLCYLRFFPGKIPVFAGSPSVSAGFFFGSLYSVISMLFFMLLAILVIIFSMHLRKTHIKKYRTKCDISVRR